MTDLSPTPLTDAAVREATAFSNIEGLGPLRRCSEALELRLAVAEAQRDEYKKAAEDCSAHYVAVTDERRAAEARNAALVKALKAAPCGQDGFDNPTWDCGEAHCLRCAALTEQQPKEQT